MLYLHLTRHGETVWNTQNRMQGRQDSPLTDIGLAQAFRLAEALKDVPLNFAWSSPAPRAVKTAGIILAAQKNPPPLQIDDRIQEMSLGDWEGLSLDGAEMADPANLHAFLHAPDQFKPVGPGENFQQVSDRMMSFLGEITQLARQLEKDGQDRYGLVVSHNITLKALFALMQNRPLGMLRDGPPIRQAAVYQASLADRWQIVPPDIH